MPQMSPIQWTLFLNLFMIILLASAIITNFLIINNHKYMPMKTKIFKKINFKW